MWFWLALVLLGIVAGGIVIARDAIAGRSGTAILGVAVGAVVLIEMLVRVGAISSGQGTDIMAIVVLVLLAVAFVLRRPLRGSGDSSEA